MRTVVISEPVGSSGHAMGCNKAGGKKGGTRGKYKLMKQIQNLRKIQGKGSWGKIV
jgi:hypothetical protein